MTMRLLAPTAEICPLLFMGLLACGESSNPSLSGSTDTSTASSVTPSTSLDPSTSAATDEPPTTTGTESSDFIPFPDLDLECDIFAQDCRPGEKCVPWANDRGNAWNATRCVAITGAVAPGEPCTAPDGPVTGVDDCAAPSICWDVGPDNQGTCVAQCGGDRDHPVCPPQSACAAGDHSPLAVCLPACDPLADDCAANEVCIPALDGFLCIIAGNAGAINDPCEFINSCDKGLACIDPTTASSACDPQPTGCCQPFCALPNSPCPNPDQECVQWFAPQMPLPEGYENVGVCAIPD